MPDWVCFLRLISHLERTPYNCLRTPIYVFGGARHPKNYVKSCIWYKRLPGPGVLRHLYSARRDGLAFNDDSAQFCGVTGLWHMRASAEARLIERLSRVSHPRGTLSSRSKSSSPTRSMTSQVLSWRSSLDGRAGRRLCGQPLAAFLNEARTSSRFQELKPWSS